MEVRIRRASEGCSRHLTNSSLDKLDSVIPTLKSWGIAGCGLDPVLEGQIWVDEGEGGHAYFEVIIDDSDDQQLSPPHLAAARE